MKLPRWLWPFGDTEARNFAPEPEDNFGSRDTWRPRDVGPNGIDYEWTLMRSRVRDLVERNPHAASAMQGLVGNLVGTGIPARSLEAEEWFNTKFGDTFTAWADSPVDIQGQHNFWSVQRQLAQGLVVVESLVQRVPAKVSDGLEIPLMLRPIESEMLDHTMNEQLSSGNVVVNGVELDPRGRRVAYWLYRHHPGDRSRTLASSLDTVRVPEADIAHFFFSNRMGATRGSIWLSPVVSKLRDQDDLDDAELVAAKIAACFTVVVTTDAPNASKQTVGPTLTDAKGKRIEQLEPGLIVYQRGGGDIKSFTPAAKNGAELWRKSNLQTISAGMRIPYAIMTGDLSNTSWASSRVGHAQFHRSMSMLQHQSFIPGMRKVGKWIVDAGYVAGKWRRPAIKLGWTPPRFESPNPLEDAKVSALRVRNGQSTLGMEIASDGNDPHEVWRERAKELAEHERLKLILDTDPGKTMAPGGAGAVAYTQDAPPTDTNPAGS